ncbi:hypothetical protein MKX03_014770, partial [Papaver bracteatum]
MLIKESNAGNNGDNLVLIEEEASEARLGKRQRSSIPQSIPKSDSSNNSVMTSTTTTTNILDNKQVSSMEENSANGSKEYQ